MLSYRGQAFQQKDWTYRQKMVHDMELLTETKENYDLVNMLFIICIDRDLKLIMENPYSEEHFLRRYWCYPASVIDKDRRENGDYYKKPTQYWFLNCEPQNNFLFEATEYNAIECSGFKGDSWRDRRLSDYQKTGADSMKTARSMIHPSYARRFIRTQILKAEAQ